MATLHAEMSHHRKSIKENLTALKKLIQLQECVKETQVVEPNEFLENTNSCAVTIARHRTELMKLTKNPCPSIDVSLLYITTEIPEDSRVDFRPSARLHPVPVVWTRGDVPDWGVVQARAGKITMRREDVRQTLSIGLGYYRGDGVAQNYSEAARWFRLAACNGDSRAQNNLGILYNRGLGVKQDFKKAARLFGLAAAEGYARAQHNLAFLYYEGLGVVQDFVKANRLTRLSAIQGHVPAVVGLGFQYFHGHGVQQDFQEAARWYRLAAERGNTTAKHNLAFLYLHGMGVETNCQEAASWLRSAS
jgi:TPR repeat protein